MHKIGLLGASAIAPQAIIDPASILPGAEILAVAARDGQRAQDYAWRHGIPRSYKGYQALLDDPEITLVYNGLPPRFHAQWSIKALEAGKHVLCEKPLSLSSTEARAMVAAAKAANRRVVEAFHCRYHPAFATLLGWIAAERIGPLRQVRAHFSVPLSDDGERNQYRPAMGGGSIGDMGCYPLHWTLQLTEAAILLADVSVELAGSGVDLSMNAALSFADGLTAELSSSMDPAGVFSAFLHIEGEQGRIKFENPLAPHQGASLTLFDATGAVRESAPISTVTSYCYQLKALLEALETGQELPTEGGALLRQQSGLDLLHARAGIRRE